LKAEANALHFEVMVGGELIQYISADEGRIRQVLINLLGNAVKFTERGSITLRISLDYRADQRLWLSALVEDTGVGMSAEELARLFQPFVQGQAGQQIRHGGTGLGLAISQGVARLMGGDISASSRPGKGSRFCFEIPVEHSAELDFIRNSGAHRRVIGIQAPRQPPCVLIADDVADNRDWLSRLLASVGFSVRSVEDGEAAVQVWEEWHPHLILMDMHMPVMGGLEATWRIRSRPKGKDTVIIALTADVLDGHRRAVLGSEVNDFLPKPCPEADLLDKIRKHLGLVYLYREETEADPADARAIAAALNPEQMRAIPADLIGQLHEATVSGDKARLDELISTVNSAGATQPAVALKELADSYEYDRLIQLLESA
jgi:CheY-like chemotaxis protein